MKNSIFNGRRMFTFCATILLTISLFGQTPSAEALERAKQFNEIYPVVMKKLDAGTLTLEDEDYKTCKSLLRKMNSYDKYTTLKEPEMQEKEKTFNDIKTTLKIGTVYLSKSKNGETKDNQFSSEETIFLIINGGQTLIEESMESDENGNKALKIYFTEPVTKAWGEIYLPVAEKHLKEHKYVAEIKFDVADPIYKHVCAFLGQIALGKNELEFSLVRSNFSSTVSMNLPRINIPISLDVKSDKYEKAAAKNADEEYNNVTLGKAAVSNTKLESEMKALYEKSYPEHKVLRLIIEEDWYDLKNEGILNYKKANAYLAVKKEDGNCYRVHVGYVKENISKNGGVELGPTKILETGAAISYTKMPCDNVNK